MLSQVPHSRDWHLWHRACLQPRGVRHPARLQDQLGLLEPARPAVHDHVPYVILSFLIRFQQIFPTATNPGKDVKKRSYVSTWHWNFFSWWQLRLKKSIIIIMAKKQWIIWFCSVWRTAESSLTTFPWHCLLAAHTPDNSFMGFVAEELNKTERLHIQRNKVNNMAVVYGKEASMWKVSVSAKKVPAASIILWRFISRAFQREFY